MSPVIHGAHPDCPCVHRPSRRSVIAWMERRLDNLHVVGAAGVGALAAGVALIGFAAGRPALWIVAVLLGVIAGGLCLADRVGGQPTEAVAELPEAHRNQRVAPDWAVTLHCGPPLLLDDETEGRS